MARRLQRTLLRVERDLGAGRLNTARRKLHGLVDAYPHALTVREKLGDLYARLGNPVHAGRYWYLAETSHPLRDQACAAFEARFGNDPVILLRKIDYRGDLDRIAGTVAAERLLALQRRAAEEQGVEVTFGPRPSRHRHEPPIVPPLRTLLPLGCGLLVALALALMLIGLNQVIRSILGG